MLRSQMVKENKKIIRENKEIKRKSMALLGKAGVDLQVFEISLDDIQDEGESSEPEVANSEQSILIEELQYTVKGKMIRWMGGWIWFKD